MSLGYTPPKNEEVNTEIRNAYKEKNSQKSRALHESKMKKMKNRLRNDSNETDDDDDNYVIELATDEDHKTLGDYVKPMIYGGLDGIITTFAIVAGITGADFDSEVILVLGFANLIAAAISMGFVDYLSEKSEIEYIDSERKREEWEFENFKEGEIQEMIQIYVSKV
eukprot:UN01861